MIIREYYKTFTKHVISHVKICICRLSITMIKNHSDVMTSDLRRIANPMTGYTKNGRGTYTFMDITIQVIYLARE